jgi:hypothetical protein
MINVNNVRKFLTNGTLVTWQSGEIRATVVNINDSDETVTVALAEPYKSPCGQTFPAGLKSRIPLFEIRLVH